MSYVQGLVGKLACDMVEGCSDTVTHIDEKGYVYCAPHGVDRKAVRRCRKLRPAEIKRLERGEQISYTRP